MRRVWKEILALVITVAACCLMLGYFIGTAVPSGSYQISGKADEQDYVRPIEEYQEADPPEHKETKQPQPSYPAVININSAGVEELMSLTGIGEVRAEAIISYRETNGPFQSVEELLLVDGIGTGTLEKIRDSITIGE